MQPNFGHPRKKGAMTFGKMTFILMPLGILIIRLDDAQHKGNQNNETEMNIVILRILTLRMTLSKVPFVITAFSITTLMERNQP